MTTKPAPERPDWLVPDAPVVVYSDDPRNPQAYHRPGVWGHSYYVAPADGVKVREILDAVRRRELMSAARTACDNWSHDHTAANGAALIAALQAVEYED